ncbi:hypothetical protein PZ938_19050 [Luteipulveratus sp. YIM 133132]|uniref:hypothetical protein n=1 Tax=Luteipulveratus flavus TaxID=3031728 RepID=UPI0023B0F279|nr:hypothetical protein [Luteipulveratus sp. YIM 133132]MDE9367720.1 hypothetical protein [Luteipulveratus sp. YIM 133132]
MSEQQGRPQDGDEISDELKIDVDQEKLHEWDKIRDDYSTDAEQPARRPAFTDSDERAAKDLDAQDSPEDEDVSQEKRFDEPESAGG